MAYTLERFITTDLPLYNPVTDISPADAVDGMVGTIAGGYDSYGGDDAQTQIPYTLTYRTMVYAEDVSTFRALIDGFRALVRKSGRLYRRGEDDDSVQWCSARLMRLSSVRAVDDKFWQDVEFVFQAKTLWRGADHPPWVLDTGEMFDGGLYLDEAGFTETMASSPHTITVTNGGNRVVTNPVLTITAGGANITAATIAKTGETKIAWTGTLTAGNDLVVDCGKFTITNNGSNAYSGKAAFDSNHTIAEWLRIDPGDNDIDVTFTGGSTNSTVTVEFRDGWA